MIKIKLSNRTFEFVKTFAVVKVKQRQSPVVISYNPLAAVMSELQANTGRPHIRQDQNAKVDMG